MSICPIVVIRPQPGAAATAARLREAGWDPLVAPLFGVEPVAWDPPDPDSLEALLVGSANAFRHGGPALGRYRSLPVYAVGAKTAAMAEKMGFRIAATGSGGLAALIPALRNDGVRIAFRLAGEDRVELPVSGPQLIERTVYRSRALAMPETLAQTLSSGGVVLVHSARAAEHFAQQCAESGLDRSGIALAAFAPAVAAAAGPGWRAVRTAAEPSDTAMLALLPELCQKPYSCMGNGTQPSEPA